MEAIIYARFSKLDQISGNSTKRQIEMARAFCDQHGWNRSPDREHVERGKSAFSGANREPGAFLHTFEREVEIGLHRNSVLVVEALDRVSRQGWEIVLAFINKCISNGVTLASVSNARIYHAYQRVEMMEVMEVILKGELAESESAEKSRRVRAAFAEKRSAASKGSKKAITGRPPAWIAIDPQTRIPKVIEERAEIVREAFSLAEIGHGTTSIARIFNERNIPTWLDKGTGWHESYVSRMLSSRSVLGEFVSPLHGERIFDHYPAIITADLFNRVAADRQRRATKQDGRVTEKMTNLFSGLTRCDECGANMVVKMSRRVGRSTKIKLAGGREGRAQTTVNATYLYCYAAKRHVLGPTGERLCFNNRTIRYERIEPVILDQVLRLAFDNDQFNQREVSDARVALAEIERQIEFHEEQAVKLGENLKDQISPTLMRMLGDVEEKVAQLRRDRLRMLDQLSGASASAESPAMLERIRETRLKIDSENPSERRDARVMVRDALKSVISRILCDEEGAVTVIIAGGIAAFKVDAEGVITDRYDASGDEAVIRAMTSGERAKNAPAVRQLLERAKQVSREERSSA